MQHYECTAESLTQLELMKGLYTGKCSYRYETGGAVGNLRRSTSIEKVSTMGSFVNRDATSFTFYPLSSSCFRPFLCVYV